MMLLYCIYFIIVQDVRAGCYWWYDLGAFGFVCEREVEGEVTRMEKEM